MKNVALLGLKMLFLPLWSIYSNNGHVGRIIWYNFERM